MRITTHCSLTTSAAGLDEAVPEIGRIGLGFIAKTAEGKSYPVATDYFVPRGEAQALFTEQFGDQPRRLPICFYSDDEEASCSVRLEIRDRKGDLYSYSDGQTYYFRPKDGSSSAFTKLINVDKVPDIAQKTEAFLHQGLSSEKAKQIRWQQTLYLRFMIRNFPQIGYWQIMAHGVSTTIPQVTRMVDTWKRMLGSLCLTPFNLVIKRGRSKGKQFTYLNLLPDFSWQDALLIARHRTATGAKAALTEMALLSADSQRAESLEVTVLPIGDAAPALPAPTGTGQQESSLTRISNTNIP